MSGSILSHALAWNKDNQLITQTANPTGGEVGSALYIYTTGGSLFSTGGIPALQEASLLSRGRIPALHKLPCSPQGGFMLSRSLPALHREDFCSPKRGFMLSKVRIADSLFQIDKPRKLQTPFLAELDVHATKSQNEHWIPERGSIMYRKEGVEAHRATKKKWFAYFPWWSPRALWSYFQSLFPY